MALRLLARPYQPLYRKEKCKEDDGHKDCDYYIIPVSIGAGAMGNAFQ